MPDQMEKGRAIRGQVMGQDWSEGALSNATDFDRPFQELALRYGWGEVWGRPGLDRRTRSILNLGMLSALGRWPELKLHVRGALANGVTKREIQETLLQVCIYCGIPAGGEAFRAAREVFEEEGRSQTG